MPDLFAVEDFPTSLNAVAQLAVKENCVAIRAAGNCSDYFSHSADSVAELMRRSPVNSSKARCVGEREIKLSWRAEQMPPDFAVELQVGMLIVPELMVVQTHIYAGNGNGRATLTVQL